MSPAPGLDKRPPVDGYCEGLGPVAARCLLDRRAADWRPGAGLVAAPTLAWSPKAAAAARALGPGRAEPEGSVSSPGAALLVDGVDGPARRFDAQERDLPGLGPDGGPFRVADAWVFDLDHWSRLLWANLRALGPFLWERLVGHPAWLPLRLAFGGRFVERGAGAVIHRAATVEGCVLGPGARVGAGAVVRGCVLGEGAVVEELAMVEGTVLGPGARVQRQAMAKYAVLEEGSAFAGTMQLGVLGAGAVVKHGGVLMDKGLGQAVRVLRKGVLEEVPYGMIGVCVGPRAVLGQGVRVAPGRTVPAGLTVLGDPGGILRDLRLPEACSRAVVRNGALEPLA